MRVTNSTSIQDAVNSYYGMTVLDDRRTLFLESNGIVIVGDLKWVHWRQAMGYITPLGSEEWSALLILLDWMAYTNHVFKDLNPAQVFPTVLKGNEFGAKIDHALKRRRINRLEMLRLFTSEELREASNRQIGDAGLAILKQALAQKGLTFRTL